MTRFGFTGSREKLYATLETLKHNGDNFAAEIQNRLRIIVR